MGTIELHELDLDGHIVDGVRYIGKALLQPNGKWACLADVNGALCRVEVSIQAEVTSKPTPTLKVQEMTPKIVKLPWTIHEIVPGSPEALEQDERLQISRWQETDLADKYLSDLGVSFDRGGEWGWTSIPVLEFVNGRAWNNAALIVVHSLRPSSIRVLVGGGRKANASNWRVTVALEDDGRTIAHITQEVEVGLTGCRFGMDVDSYIKERTPNPNTSGMINPRWIAKKADSEEP